MLNKLSTFSLIQIIQTLKWTTYEKAMIRVHGDVESKQSAGFHSNQTLNPLMGTP